MPKATTSKPTATPAKKVGTAAKLAEARAKLAEARAKPVAARAKPTKAVASVKKAAPAAKAAPAKKAAVAKKTTATKAVPAKKAKAAPAKQAAPAKKAPAAKKAAPAKKAPAPKKAAAPAPAPVKKVRKPTTVICPLSGFEVKPEKPNLSPRTLERLETMLREERARHVAQADTMAAEAELLAAEREGGDTQFDEESGEGDTINIERERDLLLSASANQIVEDIDRALERIADGTYGVCVPAGRRISIERLDALPYAETCVDCKARAERRR
jgi:RNA polymerase-binding transcription factor